MSRFVLVLATFLIVLASTADAQERVVCNDLPREQLIRDVGGLTAQGYTPGREEKRKKIQSMVGTGLKLGPLARGVLAVGALAGSPAAKAELPFHRGGLEILAVDGRGTSDRNVDEVRAMILGPQMVGTPVLITFMPRNGGRQFDRYFELQRFSSTNEYFCIHFVPPKK